MKNKTHYIHRIVIAVTAIIMLSAATSLCQATDKQNTPRSSKDKTILDPARSYVDQIMPLSEEEIKRSNVLRYIADFNNDGLQDIAVSDSFTGLWGNGGGKWKLYLKRVRRVGTAHQSLHQYPAPLLPLPALKPGEGFYLNQSYDRIRTH